MKATTAIQQLNKVADNATQGNVRGTKAWQLVLSAIRGGKNTIRPCRVQGKGRYIKNADYTWQVRSLLDAAKIKYNYGNDAPRGGLTGNYIVLTHIEY